VREPKWTRAAYASAPSLKPPAWAGESRASAHIECWSGTVDELNSVIEALGPRDCADDNLEEARISWSDGTQTVLSDFDSIRNALPPERFADVLAIRFVAKSASGVGATMVARRKIPGLELCVEGSDAASVLGTGEILFQRMMAGYVDRMGGFRPLVWMLLALAPMILVSWAVERNATSATGRLVLVAIAVLSGLSLFALSGPKLLVDKPLALLEFAPKSRFDRWKASALSAYRHRYAKATLAVLGALVVGIIGNKLSELIPFP
jgi:hypothetical protein